MKHPFLHDAHRVGRFADQSVVDRYHLRPTYPPETFTILGALIVDEPRVVLDVGCGTGNVARPLASCVERIDAVDLSLPMLERARTLPGGDSPKIRWLQGRTEEVSLEPPYALVTAGESLHWMEWDVVLPRLARALTPHGLLAILTVEELPAPWHEGYRQIEQRFTNNPAYQPFDWITALEKERLFQQLGTRETAPVSVSQAVLPLDIVDKSISPLQTSFRLCFVSGSPGRSPFPARKLHPSTSASIFLHLPTG
jgi:2-polyprenyl-3-methyl-5-hydroxy-6-metoxy-1,4-benzoquinol methylase